MREYGQIQCSLWNDPDFQALSDQGKTLVCYLLAGPHSNGIGCYRVPDGYVSTDLNWPLERVTETLSELFRIGFVNRCERTFFVLLPGFLKWNPVVNGNVAKARIKEFYTVPKKASIYSELCGCLKQFGNHWPKGFETLLKGYTKQEPTLPNPNPTQNTCAETDSAHNDDIEIDVIARLPMKNGEDHLVRAADVQDWELAYPNVDVPQQIKAMQAWCNANPTKLKMPRGIRRFIVNWLASKQDKAASRPRTSHTGLADKDYTEGLPQAAPLSATEAVQ